MRHPPKSEVAFQFYPELMERSDAEVNLLVDQMSLDAELLKDLNGFLLSFLLTIRFNTLVDLDEVGALWERIRESNAITDFLLDHTTALQIHANTLQSQGWSALVAIVSEAWGSFNLGNENDSVVKVARESERFLTPEMAQRLIMGNPWLVSLHFLRCSSYTRDLLRQASTAAAARYQATLTSEGQS